LVEALVEDRFSRADWEELLVEAGKELDVREPWSIEEASARRRELEAARLEGVVEGERKAYEAFAEGALGKAARVQMLALDRVLEGATTSDGVVDPRLVDDRGLRLALGVAKELADRVLGKAVQKSEGRVEHSFLMRMMEDGVLDEDG
jgi:hypothetical protein